MVGNTRVLPLDPEKSQQTLDIVGIKSEKLWKQVRDQGNKLESGNKLKMKLKVYYMLNKIISKSFAIPILTASGL